MGTKAKHDFAPQVRGSFLRALKKIKKTKGRTLSDILADCLEENPLATLQVVAKFAPKEQYVSGKVQHDHRHLHHLDTADRVQEITAFVGEFVERIEDRHDEAPVQDQPVLPDPLRLQQT